MKHIKHFFFFLLIVVSLNAEAQFRNQGRGLRQQPMPNQNQPRAFEFHPEKAIGIVTYDIEKSAKKIGLKKGNPAHRTFTSLLTTFNKDVKDMVRINRFTFNQKKQEVESAHKLAKESRDISILQNAYKDAGETFKPIVDQLKEKEDALDKKLQPILTKKQFSKWKKYKKKQKTKGL